MEYAPAIVVLAGIAALLFGIWRAACGDKWARYLYGPISNSKSE